MIFLVELCALRPSSMVRHATLYVKQYQVMIHDRDGEVRDSTKQGTAKVVVQGERITEYTTGMSFYNHSVGLTNDDLKALIA